MIRHEHDTHCPHCGRTNELHSSPDPDGLPAAGDASICWGCRGVGVFDDGPSGLVVRTPTPQEQASFDTDPHLSAVIAAMNQSYSVRSALDAWPKEAS